MSESHIAAFFDLENVAIGARSTAYGTICVETILERLLEKGSLSVKRAYADWSRYESLKRSFHESAVELVDLPQKRIGGKNSADIKMVVDALEVAYTKEHVDLFALVTGDSDFTPLVSKLRENNKRILGVGVRDSTSELLVRTCDEFIFYDDLVAERTPKRRKGSSSKKEDAAFDLALSAIRALERESKETIWASMVKQTMKRKRPSFDESAHGFRSFSEMLRAMEKQKLIKMSRCSNSRSLIVEETFESGAA